MAERAGPTRSLRVIGSGRAGGSLMGALAAVGWEVLEPLGRSDDLTAATHDVDLLVIATPDAAIAAVAASIDTDETTVVAHLAGSLGLDVLAPHARRAAIHPLVALSSAELGASRLRGDVWFALAGDELGREVVADLDGRAFEVADDDRAAYHAAACIASNHLVALLGQVERVAASVGVPFEAYTDLARATLDNVDDLGPATALTGPAARGDWPTIERHRSALDPSELEAYDALVLLARRLVDDSSGTDGSTGSDGNAGDRPDAPVKD